ncbi:hypothetical protein M0R45_016090 [Rubus argutus]|uniref:NADH dehydrogenase subunit 6 n=1 Tax=Rubus argutus TaxID=59490 RepID=A0AAW1XSH3_RUBAR
MCFISLSLFFFSLCRRWLVGVGSLGAGAEAGLQGFFFFVSGLVVMVVTVVLSAEEAHGWAHGLGNGDGAGVGSSWLGCVLWIIDG